MNNEETPETATDETIVAQLKAGEEDTSCLCGEDHETAEGVPGLEGLMDYLVQQFSAPDPAELESRLAHEERMKTISSAMRDSMVGADEKLGEEHASDRLAWGLWKSGCGCIHLGLPDGKGGWATRPEELEEVATSAQIKEIIHAVAQTGVLLMEVALGLEEEGR